MRPVLYQYLQKLITCEQIWCITVTLQTSSTYNWSLQCQTERLTDGDTHRQTETEKECYPQTDWHTVILTDRLRERESATYRQTDIQCYPQTDLTERQSAIHRETGQYHHNLLEMKAGVRYKQEPQEISPPVAVYHRLQIQHHQHRQTPECGLIPYIAQLGSVLARTSSGFYRATQLC